MVKSGRGPTHRRMTCIALRRGLYMRRGLAQSGRAIVTTGTLRSDHTRIIVVHSRRGPGRAAVTVLASIAADNMRWSLTRGGAAIVAAGTGAG